MYSSVGSRHERSWFAVCNPSSYAPADFGLLQNLRVAYFLDPESVRRSMSEVGVCLVNRVLDGEQVEELKNALPENCEAIANLLDRQAIRELACSDSVRGLATAVLGEDCFAVRAVFLNKPAEANGKVSFHQDVRIEVESRNEAPGFENWAIEAGVPQVQPPSEILERMVSIRLHLDNARSDNGPLRIFRGSHKSGRLTGREISRIVETETAIECRVPVGGALMMKPLVVHGSSSALKSTPRRVIHIDYAAEGLPYGLKWHQRVSPA